MAPLGTLQVHRFATVSMDTWVNVQVVSDQPRDQVEAAARRALDWFSTVERICTRFDPSSEVMQLLQHVGTPVPVSTLLLEVTAFALDLAEATDGVFDPTLGSHLEQLGFDTNYRTGQVVRSAADQAASYRDVRLDRRAGTLLLQRPVVLDLNSVAKGLALDLAAQEVHAFPGVCIEAGGDVVVRGHTALGDRWHVGIQHPRAAGLLARTLRVTDTAVCTSGDYERRAATGGHILDGRTRRSVSDLASVTVVAPTALAADGLSTAAMALGRERGLDFLDRQGVGGICITTDGAISTTRGGLPATGVA